jgi:hypothetical protein
MVRVVTARHYVKMYPRASKHMPLVDAEFLTKAFDILDEVPRRVLVYRCSSMYLSDKYYMLVAMCSRGRLARSSLVKQDNLYRQRLSRRIQHDDKGPHTRYLSGLKKHRSCSSHPPPGPPRVIRYSVNSSPKPWA